MPGQGVVARNLTLRSHLGADHHPTLALGTLWFALYRGSPAAGGVEPDGTGAYTRVGMTNDATLWGTIGSSDVAVSTIIDVTWPSTSGLYSITDELNWWGVHDLSAGGVIWYWGELQTPILVDAVGDIPRIPAGSLNISQPA